MDARIPTDIDGQVRITYASRSSVNKVHSGIDRVIASGYAARMGDIVWTTIIIGF